MACLVRNQVMMMFVIEYVLLSSADIWWKSHRIRGECGGDGPQYWLSVPAEGPAGQEVRPHPGWAHGVRGRERGGDQRVVSQVGVRRLGEITPPQLQEDLSRHLDLAPGSRTDWFKHRRTSSHQRYHIGLILPSNILQVEIMISTSELISCVSF